MGKRSYLDPSVIINALKENDERAERAQAVLEDPTRDLIVGDYVKLETLPKMVYNKRSDQAAYTTTLFDHAEYVHSTNAIVTHAETLAEAYGLSAMDALHVASAIAGHADELITFEKPEKPFFRIPDERLRIVSLYEATL
ncbi:MAG: PIN domain-containing protein [Spirochaetaceae bacterium]|jgi:predicted nucleic acid-binding protein|nr:PIN domain-containing protein [Spirochaetaceae bacterium]